MQKIKVLFVVCSTLFFASQSAHANNCAIQALTAAKAAGNNTTVLKQLYNTYFGEPFAQHAAGVAWNNPNYDRAAQIERAQNAVLTLAHHLAPYADATFIWSGSLGNFRLGTEHGVVIIHLAGKGCMMTDVCISDKGCLSSYIPKSNLTAQK